MSTADPTAAARGITRQDVFSVLGTLGAVLTLVTGVMFYFGWRRSDVQAREMGIDVSLFGYSTQDYVLRSISALYLPLLVVAGLVLGAVWLHGRVGTGLRSPALDDRRRAAAASWVRVLAVVSGTVAVCCALFTLAAGSTSPTPWLASMTTALRDRQWVVPLLLVTATLSAAYAAWVHRQLRPGVSAAARPLWQVLLPAVVVAVTVVLSGVWLLEEYATAVGRGYAQQVSAGVDRLSRATVSSPAPLGIEAPGVTEERLGAAGSPEVRYRTTGLRLLALSGGKVLLVHDGWTPTTGTVIVVADSDQLGWQFSR